MAWQAELDLKQRQSIQAVKFVLESKANNFASSQSLQQDCLERISRPAFPPEPRLLVIEATVTSQVPHWRIDQSTSLDQVTKMVSHKWPENLSNDMRGLL